MPDVIRQYRVHKIDLPAMIALEKFPEHIKTLQPKEWERLFELIPQIESTSKFGEFHFSNSDAGLNVFPYWNPTQIVEKTFEQIFELKLTPDFDWPIWEEGKIMLTDAAFDFTKLDLVTLCKLLTTIIRADKFNDGYLISFFETGIMSKNYQGFERKSAILR